MNLSHADPAGSPDHVVSEPNHVAAAHANNAHAAMSRRDLSMLTKPRITLMVGITASIGYALAPGAFDSQYAWTKFFAMLIGVAMSCMGAAALNQFFEIESDGKMKRTQNRPLPAGRVHPAMALWLGIILGTLGVTILRVAATPNAALLAAATIVLYVLVYTPLKRVTWLNTWIGAIPGATPPLIGYAAVTNNVDPIAWILFAIMVVWQIPHFYAIAWIYREQYAAANYQMLPVIDPSGKRTFRQILLGCVLLIPLTILPTYLGLTGVWQLSLGTLAALIFLILAINLVRLQTIKSARIVFFYSLIYLPVVLVIFLLDAN